MKKITKDNKGITLIVLVLTIILMLILLSVTTYTGLNTYKNSRVSKFVTQMQLLQAKVDDLVATKSTEELNNLELQTVTTEKQTNAITSAFKQGEVATADITKYKVFTKENVLDLLDVEDVQNDILVNFETREIVDVIGIEHNGTTYYTQYKLPGGQTIINGNTEVSRDLSFTLDVSTDGINSTVTAKDIKITNGTLSYKEQNDNYWQTVTNYTESGKSYERAITKSGSYTFRIQDNTDSKNYVEDTIVITLTNKPSTDIDLNPYNYTGDSDTWAYSQKDGVNYVWIPRFAYKTNTQTNTTDIKFIKGNSDIATDNTYIDNTWSIHNKFTSSGGTELTGLWVSVDTINQTGLNMITLLDDDSTTTLIEI